MLLPTPTRVALCDSQFRIILFYLICSQGEVPHFSHEPILAPSESLKASILLICLSFANRRFEQQGSKASKTLKIAVMSHFLKNSHLPQWLRSISCQKISIFCPVTVKRLTD